MSAKVLSVVIACYNVEKYVEQAVRSVMNQTLKELEIICVDDASSDRTPDILKRLAVEDRRIRILTHERNQGSLAVRCHGVQMAQGEYITFLDGDDFLTADICEAAIKKIRKEKVDVVQFGAELIETQHVPVDYLNGLTKLLKPYNRKIKNDASLVDVCFMQRRFCWNVCAKVFNAACVKKAVQFYNGERILMAEDMLQLFMTLVFSKGYTSLRKKGYCYRQGTGVTAAAAYYPIEKVRIYAEEYQVYQLLDDWLERLELKEAYKEELAFVKKRVATDMFYTMALRIRPEDRSRASEILTQYWPVRALATGLAASIPWMENWKDKAEMIASLHKCEFLKAQARTVRTVGLFVRDADEESTCRTIQSLISAWKAEGYRTVLLTQSTSNQVNMQYDADRVFRIPAVSQGVFEEIDARSGVWAEAIEEGQIDAMVYQNWFDQVMMSDSIVIRAAGIPLVLYTGGVCSQGLAEKGYAAKYLTAAQKRCYRLFGTIITSSQTDDAWWNAMGYYTVFEEKTAAGGWQDVWEKAFKAPMCSMEDKVQVPLEQAITVAMDDLCECLDRSFAGLDETPVVSEACADRYFVKIYGKIIKIAPKNSRRRALVKRVMAIFRA